MGPLDSWRADAEQRLERGDPTGGLRRIQAEVINGLLPHLQNPARFIEIAAQVNEHVEAGFDGKSEIWSWTDEQVRLSGEEGPQVRKVVYDFITMAVDAHSKRQARWPRRTDNDKLAAAFVRLSHDGWLAQEIDSTLNPVPVALTFGGPKTQSFVHTTHEDVLTCLRGGPLRLHHGFIMGPPQRRYTVPSSPQNESALKIALRAYQLVAEPDGFAILRIEPFTWHRRRNQRLR